MRKTVYVHIGPPVRGAGDMQRQLRAKGDTLRDAGIVLLDTWSRGHDATTGPDDHSEEAWDRVATTVLASEGRTVVMSDESLASATADQVARGLASLAEHKVHVIYVMPDFGAALMAEWQRHVEGTSRAILPAAWLDELVAGEHPAYWRAYDLADVFGRWTVPPGSVHVVVAPPHLADDAELSRRFAALIGAPIDIVDAAPSSDDRFGLEELELLRRVQEHWNDQAIDDASAPLQRDLLVRALLARRSDPRPVRLPLEHRSWVEEHVAAQRDFLAVSGFHIVGNLTDLEVSGERFSESVASPDENRMLSSSLDAMSELVDMWTARVERREVERDAERTAAPVQSSLRLFVRRARRVVTNPSAADFAFRRRVRAALPARGRRTYYLHIGAPKSGSSYLQSLLWWNRFTLMRDGVYLPGGSQHDHFLAATDFRERPYVTQASEARSRGAWDRLIDDAERSGCRKIVISSEFFSTAGADEISAKLERLGDDEVHVIYVVRDFAGLLASEWQQGVKTSPLPPWHEWLEDTAQHGVTKGLWRRHDVGAVCERWSQSPVDKVHVLALPSPGGPPDDLWRLFQSIVGWTVRTRVDTPRANEALGYTQAELLRRLQHRLTDIEPLHLRARVTKDLIADQVLAQTRRVDSPLIPDLFRAWVASESEKRRNEIVDSGAHLVGNLDDLRVNDDRFCPTPTQPSDSVMLDAAVRVMGHLAASLADEDIRKASGGCGDN